MNTIHKVKTAIGIIKLFKNWPTFFLYYFNLKKKKDAIFKFRNGLKWYVDATKRGFAVLGDVWIQKPYKLLFEIDNPKIILDFGAHIGSFSIMAAKKYPKSKIYAFEASKENFEYLKKNLEENKIKNVHPLNMGVGSKNEILEFFISEKSTIMNTFVKDLQRKSSGSCKVNCKKMSTILSELKINKCDFLKLDIEGLEYDVLRSAEKDNVLSKIGAVAAEIKPELKEFKQTISLLSKNKFKISVKGDIISAVRW